jgi:hypothetical protein
MRRYRQWVDRVVQVAAIQEVVSAGELLGRLQSSSSPSTYNERKGEEEE